jgi:hypothetical protein
VRLPIHQDGALANMDIAKAHIGFAKRIGTHLLPSPTT